MPFSLTAYAHFVRVWMRSSIEPDLFGPQCTVRQYHFDLSDHSALEITDMIKVRLKDALF